jgi:TolA-binding protein
MQEITNSKHRATTATKSGADYKPKSLKLEGALAKERSKVDSLEAQLRTANLQVQSLQADLSAIVNSRIWKSTSLLRRFFVL